jgi:hypothetical protein
MPLNFSLCLLQEACSQASSFFHYGLAMYGNQYPRISQRPLTKVDLFPAGMNTGASSIAAKVEKEVAKASIGCMSRHPPRLRKVLP